jgi:alpha-L-fucosidase 2
VGFYPGFAISGIFQYNQTVSDAVTTTLYSRGPGIIDSNAGWEKLWRGACWARLNSTDEACYELKLAILENFVGNGLDMLGGRQEPPFQVDANFGFPANVLAMLIRDLDRANGDSRPQPVLLGPAIPPAWGGGNVQGLKLRAGGSVSFEWDKTGLVSSCIAEFTERGKKGGALVPDVLFFDRKGRALKC